jgi:hypothetical protein
LRHSGDGESGGIKVAATKNEEQDMAAVVVGAAFLGGLAAAFVVQKVVLGAMFRAMGRDRAIRP